MESAPLINDEQEKPLGHLRVLDLTVMLPGPYLTRVLAQYGAEVFKVEHLPDGDPVRLVKDTALVEWLNQGKRPVALNLKTEAGIHLVRRLAAECDVLVENFREGVLEGMGLGYRELSALNPELLYVSLRGFQGRFSSRAGHDLNFVANSGCGEWFLESGPNYSTHWGDLVGGMLAPAVKVLAHLSNPDRRGMQLVSYMDESFRLMYLHRAYDAAKASALPQAERASYGSHHTFNGSQPHSRYYRCQDGQWVSLNAVQDKHWERFCAALNQPTWRQRAADSGLVPEVEKVFESAPSAYWEELSLGVDMCLVKVQTWDETMQLLDTKNKILKDPLHWAGFAAYPEPLTSASFGGETASVLQEVGVGEEEFAQYLKQGIVYQAARGKRV